MKSSNVCLVCLSRQRIEVSISDGSGERSVFVVLLNVWDGDGQTLFLGWRDGASDI